MEEVSAIVVLTQSPFSDVAGAFFNIMNSLANQISEIKLYLFYGGVLAVKKDTRLEAKMRELTQKGVVIIVDGREFNARGLGRIIEGVKVLDHPVSELVDDIMEENSRVIFV
jgi:sulfur relay protein TusB/DsrH